MKGEDLFLGLSYVNPEFIEEAETVTQLQEKRPVLSLRRPVLIAAIIAMLLMLVGCAVVYVLNMRQIHIGQQQTWQAGCVIGMVMGQQDRIDMLDGKAHAMQRNLSAFPTVNQYHLAITAQQARCQPSLRQRNGSTRSQQTYIQHVRFLSVSATGAASAAAYGK